MLTWIVAHSDSLCNFLTPLLIGFSPAQLRHALNCIEALWVCPSKHKTLSALTRLLRLPHADEFALADFFRASPWKSAPIQKAVTLFLLHTVCTIQQKTGWRLLFVRIDDALCPKDVDTRALEAMTFHFDHRQPRRQKGNFTNSSRYVTLGLQLGPVKFALAWRLYLPQKLVKQLNRTRSAETKLTFHKLPTLVIQMLDEIAPHLPKGCRVYVLFDTWYDNQHVQKRFARSVGIGFVERVPIAMCPTVRSATGGRTSTISASRVSWCGQPPAGTLISPDSSSGCCGTTPIRW